MEESEVELSRYVNDQLAEFTAKTLGIKSPPAWAWAPEWVEPYYSPKLKTIYLPKEFLLHAFQLEPIKTKAAIRGSLGHEFWHYVQNVRGDPLVVKGIKIANIPTISLSENLAERVAIERAVLLTGIGHAEHLKHWEELSKAIVESYEVTA